MRPILDEEQQAHVYSCLLAGGKVWQSMKKNREKLELPTQQEDRELELNAKLRMMFNPKAEEIAREKERKDPRQQDFTAGEGIPSSGETGGGHPPGETFKAKLRLNGAEIEPNDTELRDALLLRDRLVLITDIAEWSPEDRQQVIAWASAHQAWTEADVKGDEPEEPECLGLVAFTERRVEGLVDEGPYTLHYTFPDEGDGPATSAKVYIPEDEATERLEVVFGEYPDTVEAEIKAARLNQAFQRSGEMTPDELLRWLHTGPWEAVGRGDAVDTGTEIGNTETKPNRWYVVEPESIQKERVADRDTARATAARYNRTIAGDGAEPVLTLDEAKRMDEGWERDDKALLSMLLLVGPLAETEDGERLLKESIARWSDSEAYEVEQWAAAVHLRASDNDDVPVPATPAVIVALDPSLERPAIPAITEENDEAEEAEESKTTDTEEKVAT